MSCMKNNIDYTEEDQKKLTPDKIIKKNKSHKKV